MIAADTSSLVAYLSGEVEVAVDTDCVEAALRAGELTLPPVVVSEVLSDPAGSHAIGEQLRHIPQLQITEDYWTRAGHTRRLVLSRGFKARLADALIAQSCIDNNITLITRDRDFRHFAKFCDLAITGLPRS